MKITPLAISDVIVIEPQLYRDERGFFFESYNQKTFQEKTGISPVFVQDNHSGSVKGVLRGLHYQLPPKAQGKLVRAIEGKIFDVAVDIRKSSPTFGKWVGEILSSENKKQLWVPEGFAHGFLVLSETAEVLYKATNFYDAGSDRCILQNDPKIGIQWNFNGKIVLSPKDQQGKDLSTAEVFP